MINTNKKIAEFFNRLKSNNLKENQYNPKITGPIGMTTIAPTGSPTFNQVYQNSIKHKNK